MSTKFKDETTDRLVTDVAEALEACAAVCRECADRCERDDPIAMATCIATCRACADICDTTARVLRSGPASRVEILVEQARAAYEATRTCAIECGEHSQDHCQRCADECDETSRAVKRLLATLDDDLERAHRVLDDTIRRHV